MTPVKDVFRSAVAEKNWQNRIEEEGKQSFLDGNVREMNPYLGPNTVCWYLWNKGWTEAAEAALSKRAKKTLKLIRDGRFYMAYDQKNPATITELEEAGLIRKAARPMVLVAAYVPTKGYTDYVSEKFDG